MKIRNLGFKFQFETYEQSEYDFDIHKNQQRWFL